MQQTEPVAGRSAVTIRVGTGSHAADTSSSGSGTSVQTSSPPIAAQPSAAAADVGGHDNRRQPATTAGGWHEIIGDYHIHHPSAI